MTKIVIKGKRLYIGLAARFTTRLHFFLYNESLPPIHKLRGMLTLTSTVCRSSPFFDSPYNLPKDEDSILSIALNPIIALEFLNRALLAPQRISLIMLLELAASSLPPENQAFTLLSLAIKSYHPLLASRSSICLPLPPHILALAMLLPCKPATAKPTTKISRDKFKKKSPVKPSRCSVLTKLKTKGTLLQLVPLALSSVWMKIFEDRNLQVKEKDEGAPRIPMYFSKRVSRSLDETTFLPFHLDALSYHSSNMPLRRTICFVALTQLLLLAQRQEFTDAYFVSLILGYDSYVEPPNLTDMALKGINFITELQLSFRNRAEAFDWNKKIWFQDLKLLNEQAELTIERTLTDRKRRSFSEVSVWNSLLLDVLESTPVSTSIFTQTFSAHDLLPEASDPGMRLLTHLHIIPPFKFTAFGAYPYNFSLEHPSTQAYNIDGSPLTPVEEPSHQAIFYETTITDIRGTIQNLMYHLFLLFLHCKEAYIITYTLFTLPVSASEHHD
ncbi:uncharacterized protein BDR25DRAFT_358005 [Lindgomyces ingoldianus]|uniref:Uncharacterized protein n=1 Tax=Lindgomyces ingoldianus TaxID=673940 RepID=A0ACB6QMM0_9PLEO|nr:uncharacterized protein BDR25DRAFT_358005 [Lindgomyces ingoldianus]KAF2468274.1 hypothetical protein BDR25DRAFT_358005 [Lindgomyces ingoldianus]